MRKKTRIKLLNIVKNNYSEIATDFDISRKKYLWPEMERFTELVFSGAKVLDAGCGNGRLLEAFKDKEIDYLGFDLSEELINFAKRDYPDKKFFTYDLLELGNKNEEDLIENQNNSNNEIEANNKTKELLNQEKFDSIFLIAVILHIPGRDLRLKVIKNLAEKLNPGGRIILSIWDFYGQDRFNDLVRKSETKRIFSFDGRERGDLLFWWTSGDAKSKSLRYYHAFKDKELKKLAKDSGLELEEFYKSGKNIFLVLKK